MSLRVENRLSSKSYQRGSYQRGRQFPGDFSMSFDLEAVREALLASVDALGRPAERRFAARLRRYPNLLQVRFARAQRVLKLVGGVGGRVLDAGSGTGLNAVLSVLAGAAKVVAVELNPARLVVARDLVNRLALDDQIEVIEQDILTLDLPAMSLDGAYSNEFLEHVVDTGEYHRRVGGWLKPGASVFGRTGANGHNWIYKVSFARLWTRTDREKYEGLRREILARIAPELPGDVARRLSVATRGCDAAQIGAAVERWREDGWIGPRNRAVPKNPETGVYFEKLCYPRELVAELNEAGLEGRSLAPDFRHSFAASAAKRWAIRGLGAVIRATHPVSLFAAPWIEVLGTKAASSAR